MSLSTESIYWIFSTLPQVIAALSGLLITGITYLFTILDREVDNDSTLTEIIADVKKGIFGGVKYLIVVSILAIVIDVIILACDEQVVQWGDSDCPLSPFGEFSISLILLSAFTFNSIYFIVLYKLLVKALNPAYKNLVTQKITKNIKRQAQKIEDRQIKENEKTGIPKAPVTVGISLFWHHFRTFESLVRQLAPTDYAKGKQESLYLLVRRLVSDHLLPQNSLVEISEMIRVRNIYAHGGDITSIPKSLDDELLHITAILRDYLRKFNHKNSNSKGFFDSWISENVDNLTDAYELLQAIQFHQDYGSYLVSELKDNLLKISAYSPKPLYLSSKNTPYFINLLEKRFSEGDLSIEDAFNFRQSLDKDRDDEEEENDDDNDNDLAPA